MRPCEQGAVDQSFETGDAVIDTVAGNFRASSAATPVQPSGRVMDGLDLNGVG